MGVALKGAVWQTVSALFTRVSWWALNWEDSQILTFQYARTLHASFQSDKGAFPSGNSNPAAFRRDRDRSLSNAQNSE